MKSEDTSGVGGYDYRPHRQAAHMHWDNDLSMLYYTNWKYSMIQIGIETPVTTQVVRDVWYFCTKQLPFDKSLPEICITIRGEKYWMDYESGFCLFDKFTSDRELVVKMWARPITPHHVVWCLDNQKGMGDAVQSLKMTEDSVRLWTRKFWN